MKKFLAALGAVLILATSAANIVPALTAHAASANLITNPSLETSASNQPAGWQSDSWGTNTHAFTYLATGHTGIHSVKTAITQYTDGDAKWYFAPVAAIPNTSYTFSDWYQSTTASSVDVVITAANGTDTYLWQGDIAASSAWKQATYTFTTPANAAKITVYHYIQSVGTLTTDDASLVNNASTVPVTPPTAPTVSISAPSANAAVSGTATTLSATAADAKGIANVQFKIDGVNIGVADTTSPYSAVWNTTTATNGAHSLTAVATNTSNLTTTSTPVSVTVNNLVAPTPPTVSISAPVANASVSGTAATVTATAADAKGIANVQFKLDGANLGTPVTTSPYSATWDTTKVANGSHVLTAVATSTSNLTATSTNVTVSVNNVVTPPVTPPTSTNLIPNPSVETASGNAPANWISSNWGTNTSTFSYLNTGHTGSHSLEVQTTAYTNGAANWYYADVPVTSGQTYQYTNWYKTNVDSEVDAEVTMSDGTVQYAYLGTVLANTSWTQFKATYTVPSGAKSMAVYQILAKVGYVISDDYSLSNYAAVPFNRGLVSISFDDGWTNQYTNAAPLLKKYGLVGTYNIISGELADQPDYMSAAQVKALYASGNEIASHSVTHPDMTTLTSAQLTSQMSQSQTTLQNLLGAPVTDFAYPYGAYNNATLAEGSKYYQTQRTVNGGLNTKDNLNLTQLKIYEVDSNISQAQVKGWVDAAIAQKSWLILVFHEVAVTPSDPTDALYDTQPADMDAELAYIKSTGIAAVTMHQAVTEVLSQF
jgi:peptidoglycan/xylan/chitin deacetylase (PgdA/CDA1 family)